MSKMLLKMKQSVTDVYCLVSTALLIVIAVFASISNILFYDNIGDLVDILLMVIVVLFILYSYFLFFIKNDINYRYYIAVPLTVYFGAMLVLASYSNPPVYIGFFFSLIYFILTPSSNKIKIIYIITAVLFHCTIAVLQNNNMLPMTIEEEQFSELQKLATLITTNILIAGIAVFLIFHKDMFYKKPPVTEFIFCFNENNTSVPKPDQGFFENMLKKHQLTKQQADIMQILIKNPEISYKEIADIYGLSAGSIGKLIALIKNKVEINGKIRDELGRPYNLQKKNLIKYFSGKKLSH